MRETRWQRKSTSICICRCGETVTLLNCDLLRGSVNSCGCLRREIVAARSTVHGHASRLNVSPTYESWHQMKRRCNNINNAAYENYGGRGISVCIRWSSFNNFLADMGECPLGLTLGRKNNDGNYEPSNCEWQTNTEQNRNKRTNRMFTVNGLTGCLSFMAERFGIRSDTAIRRIDRMGWPVEKSFTTPLMHK